MCLVTLQLRDDQQQRLRHRCRCFAQSASEVASEVISSQSQLEASCCFEEAVRVKCQLVNVDFC